MVPIRLAGHGQVNKAVASGLYRLATRAGVGSQPTKCWSSDQLERPEQQRVQGAGGGESGESHASALRAETLPAAMS